MYSDNPGPDEQPAMAQAEDRSPDGDDGETAVLPKSILAGKDFKPGEEVVLKIVAIHDDSVEVAYATDDEEHKEGKEEPEGGAPAPEAESSGGSSSMYE